MKPLTAIATVVLFGAFGYISCAQKENKWLLIGIAVALGLVIVFILQQLLKSGAGAVVNKETVAADALEHGILFLIPFVVLALLADLWLGWHSAQTFFSAGLSSVAITSGSVMLKNGGPRITSIIIPMIWALAGGLAWMLITAKI
jgi:hypothetical protein